MCSISMSCYQLLYPFIYQQQKQSKMDLLYCLHMYSYMTKFEFKYERPCKDAKAMLNYDDYHSIHIFIFEPHHEKVQTTTINLLQLHSLISIIAIVFYD